MVRAETSEIYRRWDDGFVVRRLRRDDEPQVIRWYDNDTVKSFDLQVSLDMRRDDANAHDFYAGELNGELVASVVLTPVADDLKQIGFLRVVEKYRSFGFARRIIATGMDVSLSQRANCVYSLDALRHLEPMLEKFACKTAYKSIGYEGTLSASAEQDAFGTNIKEVSEADFDRLMNYDDKCFIRPGSAWRRQLMSRWIKIPGGKAVMAVDQQGDIVGYGCRRPAISTAERHYIGPLYADSCVIAADLLQQLTRDVIGQRIWMIVLESNEDAVRLVREMKLENTEVVPFNKMYRNGQPQDISDRVFAITSVEICGF